MQAFVDARYEYHWAPLLGCLVGQLNHLGAAQPSHLIGAVTGISYQPPQDAELPALLEDGLRALGVEPQITRQSLPNRLQRYRARRRIRNELRADRPVTAYAVGVSAFGPAWGLIVGCDDEREDKRGATRGATRGAWRRDGPMTEQVSPWLAESEFNASPALILIAARRLGEPQPDRITIVAEHAFTRSTDRIQQHLFEQIQLLDSDIEIEPQRFAHDAQTLAANWGEAAACWRTFPHDSYTALSQQIAVTLSRYATLFPYPMGGQPNNPGVRSAAVHILHEAATALDTAH